MRPGQNKRMRGRPSNNRRGPNPLTRSYESNGPDVKIRGNAHHVAEKYLQLARDAHTGGDPVAAENYLQHAEHYFRLIAAAQAAQALAQSGLPREGEADDIEDDDDFGGMSDRFASPSERASYQQQQGSFQPQTPSPPNAPQPYVDRQQPFEPERQNQADRGGFPSRQDRQGGRFQDRNPRQPFGDRGENFRDRQNRDNRVREFRPYRDQNAPNAGSAETGAALPSFITAGPKAGGGEAESPTPLSPDLPLQSVDATDPVPTFAESPPSDGRFPGRGRRRRLRSPYGFNATQGEGDAQDSGPAVSDETPIGD